MLSYIAHNGNRVQSRKKTVRPKKIHRRMNTHTRCLFRLFHRFVRDRLQPFKTHIFFDGARTHERKKVRDADLCELFCEPFETIMLQNSRANVEVWGRLALGWVPAFAGMTKRKTLHRHIHRMFRETHNFSLPALPFSIHKLHFFADTQLQHAHDLMHERRHTNRPRCPFWKRRKRKNVAFHKLRDVCQPTP